MLHITKRIFARRAMTLPVIGILAIAATACQGVGLTEARQAVDNQRAINEIEERELLPIERELESLYENQILPRERELEDLWNQVQDLENGQFKNDFNGFQDPWAPGGAASLLQQEFNEKYAEIDRLYRELDSESRKIQIEQQFSDNSFGIDPAVAAVEDERFALQRELDRLHQFGRRPIEDLYLQMNELNASNGWSQTDVYAAEDLNRQIADIQNEIAHAQSTGGFFNDQNQQELFDLDNELNFLRTEGFFPVQELYNRIAELEQQVVFPTGATVDAAGVVVVTSDADIAAEIERLKAEMNDAVAPLWLQIEELSAAIEATEESAQAQIDVLIADAVTTVEPVDTSAMQAEIDSLNQQITDQQSAVAATIAALEVQIADLDAQVGVIFQATDTGNAELQAQIDALQAQIDALDSTAVDYAEVLADLEGQIEVLQASIDQAFASETTSVADLQAQIAALEAQKDSAEDSAEDVIADLQSQIAAKQTEIDDANSTASTSTGISQEIADQIELIENDRDSAIDLIEIDIEAVEQQVADIEGVYLPQIAELEAATGSVSTTVTEVGPTAVDLEIQALQNQVALLENELNEKIRVLEERRNKIQSALADTAASGADIAALEAKLVLLHDELNALQNSGFDASRNYNILMEELQNKAVSLEKQLSLDIRTLEDKIWEFDGRINEMYRSSNGSTFDPHAKFSARLKEIELQRFELEQRRWDLDDEQQAAFNQFNNVGSEQQAEADALRAEVLDPLYDRINVLEEELRELRLTQREIEDRRREAQKLVDEQIRELELQTLELIDDAVTAAEEGAESLSALENGVLEDFDPALLEGLDPALVDETGVAGESAQ